MLEYWKQHLSGYGGSVAECPFGPGTCVFKVGGKMFALISEDEATPRLTLKCDPDRAEELRAEYPAIKPGYYMNKQHWNTITLNGSIPDSELEELVAHSYQLVVTKLPKSVRETIGQ